MYRGRFFLLAFLLLVLALPVAYAIDSAPDVDEAINTRKVVVLYFLSDGCVPCESVTPIMDELKVTYAGSIHVFKLNTSEGETTLRSRYGIVGTPTVVILDEFGNVYGQIHEGAKSRAFYVAAIEGAMQVDDIIRADATFAYNRAEAYYQLQNYTEAKFYYTEAKTLFNELGFLATANDIATSVFCELQITKCDNYLNALFYLDRADDAYTEGEYSRARANYALALAIYEVVSDSEMISYCNDQITKSEMYPLLATQYDQALSLFNARNYAGAVDIFYVVREGYVGIGDDTRAEQVAVYITQCEDYLAATSFLSQGMTALDDELYDEAIGLFTQAREIYDTYGDEEKVTQCDSNIAIAEQFKEMQGTPVPTTLPPDQGGDSGSYGGNPYVIYGALAIVLGCFLAIVGYKVRSSLPKKPAPEYRSHSEPAQKQTALSQVSRRLLDDVPFGPAEEDIFTTVSPQKTETRTSGESQHVKHASAIPQSITATERVIPRESRPLSSDDTLQSQVIEKKNELLYLFVMWTEALYKDLRKAAPSEYFALRGRLDQMYAFYSRSFASDERYLDRDLFSRAHSGLNACQNALNDLMESV